MGDPSATSRGPFRACLPAVLLALALACAVAAPATGTGLPPGFSDHVVHGGLNEPTAVAVGSDGTTFVAERQGTIQRYDGPGDRSPTQVADLTTEVMSYSQRGLLAMALDPDYPRKPYLYVGYTYDAPLGGTAPTYGTAGVRDDPCLPGDPDPTFEDGCLVSSHVSRLTLDRKDRMRSEQVLVADWCQQYTSHSIGSLAFDDSGALLASGGEGAYYEGTDVGRQGDPANRCDDPPGEGGALRAQDVLAGDDPVSLDGSVIRIDPATGAAAPGNGEAGLGGEPRITSYGMRNPFRFTIRPGTDELWIGDVGWGRYEEIDMARIGWPKDFGWPCYEGNDVNPDYQAENAGICNSLYESPGLASPPWYSYAHDAPAVPGDPCSTAAGAISGIAFDTSDDFPPPYDGALFFADYTRNCIWSFLPGREGMPKVRTAHVFETDSSTPVQLVSAADGLYYPDLFYGTVRRITYDEPTAEVGLRSRPRGAAVTLAGRTPERRTTITVKRGSRYKISAPATLARGADVLRFDHWSDGHRRTHSVTVPGNGRYVAVYAPS
jgi:glucose/arabinose dehydrogenase